MVTIKHNAVLAYELVQINKDISWETRRGAGDDYRTALIGGKENESNKQ